MNAARVSRQLREGGLRPVGAGASPLREGIRVVNAQDGVYVRIWVDSHRLADELRADVVAILSPRYKVTVVSDRLVRVEA